MNENTPMTPAQQLFAEEHHNLVYAFLNEKKLPEDEYYDVVVFGYETNTFGRFPAGFSELLGYSDVSTSQFQFPTCQKLVQLRMFKNGRVDLKFKTASIAKEFAETYLDYSC